MADEFDVFVRDLQEQVYEEARREYGEAAYERWRDPQYEGVLEDPDGYGRLTGSCGDTMEIFLRVQGERVAEATYRTDGCGSSAVCGSFAAELARGKTPEEVTDISGETILAVLGGLPEEDRHCAFLAAATLQDALESYMRKPAG
ncbi:MAG: iron-sulfur cluster assembly scaffold protein [Deltaproteobacteria bacterium]|nr:iron-sulfur cluster assembly scaffold protein [Deltaproteobacteria bacterium]